MNEDKIIINLEKTVLGMRERLKSHMRKLSIRTQENQALRKIVTDLEQQVVDLKRSLLATVSVHPQEHRDLQTQYNSLKLNNRDLQRQIDEWDQRDAEKTDLVVDALEQKKQLEQLLQDQRRNLEHQKKVIHRLHNQLNDKPGFQAMEIEILNLRAEVENLKGIVQVGYEQVKTRDERNERQRYELGKMIESRDALREQSEMLKARVLTLIEEKKTAEGRVSSVIAERERLVKDRDLTVKMCDERIAIRDREVERFKNVAHYWHERLEKLWKAQARYFERVADDGAKLAQVMGETRP